MYEYSSLLANREIGTAGDAGGPAMRRVRWSAFRTAPKLTCFPTGTSSPGQDDSTLGTAQQLVTPNLAFMPLRFLWLRHRCRSRDDRVVGSLTCRVYSPTSKRFLTSIAVAESSKGGLDGQRVWMACECGGRLIRSRQEPNKDN